MQIDLNADVGEGYAEDRALLAAVSSANIACGAHAGDPDTMRKTIQAALRNNVAIGAHPGYPDRANFGRAEMGLSAAETISSIDEQIRTLTRIAEACKSQPGHIKLHGALYYRADSDDELAKRFCDLMAASYPGTTLYARSGGPLACVARERGIHVTQEVFADRTYEAGGSLTPRSIAGSVLMSDDEIANRIVGLLKTGAIAARDGTPLRLEADTVCLHGDKPGSAGRALRLRERLEQSGVEIAHPTHPSSL